LYESESDKIRTYESFLLIRFYKDLLNKQIRKKIELIIAYKIRVLVKKIVENIREFVFPGVLYIICDISVVNWNFKLS